MSETPSVEKPLAARASPAGPPPASPPAGSNRRALIFALLGIIAALLIALYFVVPGLYAKETDDAYVDAHVVSVISKLPAYAQTLHVDDNSKVAAGDLLVELDPRDYVV